jgi:ABC-type transport system substrate-binding protein
VAAAGVIAAMAGSAFVEVGAAPAAPVRGGVLTVAAPPGFPILDVQFNPSSVITEAVGPIYERLFERDTQGKLRPHLVKEEQVSADGLTVTWKLQPGVKFHDGTPFNAAAVKWNLDRKIEKRLPFYTTLLITSITVVDDLTLRVTLSQPHAALPAYLSLGTMMIYSPTWGQRAGDTGLRLEAVGTGPFTLTEFRPNVLVRMKRNPNYWRQGLPYLDEIVYRAVPDISTRSTMLEANDADISTILSPADIRRFRTNNQYALVEQAGSRVSMVMIHNRNWPDVRVRQALNYAIDKEAVLRAVYLGSGAQISTAYLIPKNLDGYIKAGPYPYNPDKARSLLDEAGWRVGPGGIRQREGRAMTMDFITRKGTVVGDFETAELVQGMLRAVGIDVKLNVWEAAALITAINAPTTRLNYDLLNWGNNAFSGDADYSISQLYRTATWPPAGFNHAYYGNPEIDRLIEAAQRVRTIAGRNKIFYPQIIKKVWDEAPSIMLFDVEMQAATKRSVQGLYLEPGHNAWRFDRVWMERR